MARGRGFGRWAVRGLAARRRAADDARRARLVAVDPGPRGRRLRRRRGQVVAAGRGARLRRRPGVAATRPHLELRHRRPPRRQRRDRRRHRHPAGRAGDPRLRVNVRTSRCSRHGARAASTSTRRKPRSPSAARCRPSTRALAKKLPANVLDATDDRSRSPTPSTSCSARRGGWKTSTSRCFLVGVAMLLLADREGARARARHPHRRRHARGRRRPPARRRPRHPGRSPASPPRPIRGAARRSPRSSACSSAGWSAPARSSSCSACSLALAPGQRRRRPAPPRRADQGVGRREAHAAPRWRFAGGFALMVARRSLFITIPQEMLRTLLVVVRGARASTWASDRVPAGGGAARHRPLHPRSSTSASWSACSPAIVAAGVVHRVRRRRDRRQQHDPGRARTRTTRAATATSSCARSRSTRSCGPRATTRCRRRRTTSSAPSTPITIPEQLNGGTRFLMIDAYYGYDDNGLVRTNLAGGVEPRPAAQGARRRGGARARPARARSPASPTRRARSRTSTSATTSASSARSRRSRCSTTSTTSSPATSPTSWSIDVEDYVQPKDLKRALIDAGLWRPGVEAEPEAVRVADAAADGHARSKPRTRRRTRVGSS